VMWGTSNTYPHPQTDSKSIRVQHVAVKYNTQNTQRNYTGNDELFFTDECLDQFTKQIKDREQSFQFFYLTKSDSSMVRDVRKCSYLCIIRMYIRMKNVV
jgi:hypothetical protein